MVFQTFLMQISHVITPTNQHFLYKNIIPLMGQSVHAK